MGLDTTHGCWHGAYSAFMRWREKLAEVAGLPPLHFMEGFYSPDNAGCLAFALRSLRREAERQDNGGVLHWVESAERHAAGLPISWGALRPDPLHLLLNHSDCDGEIAAADCGPIADSLERLLPLLPDGDAGGHIGNWRDKTKTFIDGLRRASAAGENVEFH